MRLLCAIDVIRWLNFLTDIMCRILCWYLMGARNAGARMQVRDVGGPGAAHQELLISSGTVRISDAGSVRKVLKVSKNPSHPCPHVAVNAEPRSNSLWMSVRSSTPLHA